MTHRIPHFVAFLSCLLVAFGPWWGSVPTALALGISVNEHSSGTTYRWETQTSTAPKAAQHKADVKRQNQGAVDEEAILYKTMDNFFDSTELRPHLDGLSPTSDANEFRKAFSTMDRKLLGEKTFDRSLVDQEIRYRIPEAAEVYFVWGINGWKPAPEKTRPPHTTLTNDRVMATLMTREDDYFVVRLRVPHGATIDYGFSITRTREGAAVDIYDSDKYPSFGYQTVAMPNHPVLVEASLTMARLRKGGPTIGRALATQEILYSLTGAREVVIAWGVNGWRLVPEQDRPPGTVVKEGRMVTPLSPDRHGFVGKMQVPPGTTLDYGFLVTTANDGKVTELWDDNHRQFFHTTVTADGVTTVKPTVKLPR